MTGVCGAGLPKGPSSLGGGVEDAFHVGEINQMQSLLVDFADGWGGGLRLRFAPQQI